MGKLVTSFSFCPDKAGVVGSTYPTPNTIFAREYTPSPCRHYTPRQVWHAAAAVTLACHAACLACAVSRLGAIRDTDTPLMPATAARGHYHQLGMPRGEARQPAACLAIFWERFSPPCLSRLFQAAEMPFQHGPIIGAFHWDRAGRFHASRFSPDQEGRSCLRLPE